MVRSLVIVMVIGSSVFAMDIYERNCIQCHTKLPATLQEMFKRYLLMYSGETNVKAGIKHYLKYPSKDISAMSDLFIETVGVKQKTWLSQDELDEAVDIYWEKFKVFNKLK